MDQRPLGSLPVACAVWEPHPDLGTSAEAWIMAGAPHHTSTAVAVEELHDLAEIARTELLVIDAGTTPRRFAQELRRNAAAHAGGTR